LSEVLQSVKALTKRALAPLLYRNTIGLRPRRFYLWLDCLQRTGAMAGAVVEIGVASGGTAAFSHRFLREGGDTRAYYCIDTFHGFVKEQFAEDVRLGNSWKHYRQFSANSMSLVRKVLDMHGATDTIIIQADVSTLRQEQLPQQISACLLDVDLAVPIYDGLKLIWPLVESGGLVAVDDCYDDNESDWQAIKGLRRFCDEMSLDYRVSYGMGFLSKPVTLST
jgi:hypothetical protein